MENLDKRRLLIQGRSDGDGMEYTYSTESTTSKVPDKYVFPVATYSKHFAPVPNKRKEPKFVPYEPYKAAVSPIFSNAKQHEYKSPPLVIDSQKVSSLASSIIQFDLHKESNSLEKDENLSTTNSSEKSCGLQCHEKIKMLEEKIAQLEKEKKEINSQFQIQTEVNADLKKMLIASLGEDMELKVQYMTEDKARLGRNVLQFTEELIVRNEEIEKLAVQSDVWKSKFEASSVMVDELARWKIALSKKLNDAAVAIDSVLKEYRFIFEQLCTTYNILKSTQSAFNPNSNTASKCDRNPKNLIQLSKEIQNLATVTQERLLGRSCPKTNFLYVNKIDTQFTPAELSAIQILEDYDNLPKFMNGDYSGQLAPCGPGKTACQILPHVCHKDPTVNCCKKCSGEIKLL